MVQRAPGDPGLGDDLLGSRAVVAVGTEQLARGSDQCRTCVGGVFGPARLRFRWHTTIM